MVIIGKRKTPQFNRTRILYLYSFVVSLALLWSIGWGGKMEFQSMCLYLPLTAATTSNEPARFVRGGKSELTMKDNGELKPVSLPVSDKSQVAKYDNEDDFLKPVDCRSFVTKSSVDTDPGGKEKVLVRTITENPFLISLHAQKYDRVRWDIFVYGRNYERSLEDIWAGLLKQAPSGSHVVDVGGNIGYYSLFSASLGNFVIDSFEPNPTNILRFCESVGVNYFGGSSEASDSDSNMMSAPKINIWEMGLSKEVGGLLFFADTGNPGAGRFIASKEALGSIPGLVSKIPVATLDNFARERGWFTSKHNIEILKVDVERHEAEVFLGGKELFRSGIVQNIFVEVGRGSVNRALQVQALKLLIESGYRLAGQGNFRGPDKPSLWPHDDSLAQNIVDHINRAGVGRREPYLNLWWKLATTEDRTTL